MTHTPGPWEHNELQADQELALDDYLPCAVWANGLFIANTQPHAGFKVPDELERAANCRLMAAAPDLLEACIKALVWLHERSRLSESAIELSDQLVAAIAKAIK